MVTRGTRLPTVQSSTTWPLNATLDPTLNYGRFEPVSQQHSTTSSAEGVGALPSPGSAAA